MKLVLFDVDGTLISGASSEQRFFLYLFRRGQLGLRQLLGWCVFALRYLPRYGGHVGKKNKSYLAGLPVDRVRELAKQFVQEDLAHALIPEAVARLNVHLRAGDRVLLLTGTPDFIAEPLAGMLGAEAVIAARCRADAGRFLALPPESHPYAGEKLRLAEQLCAARGWSMSEVIAYADSRTDLMLLSRVGKAVAVRADRQLRAVALEKGWELI